MEYSYPYGHPGLNYVYSQVPQSGFTVGSGALNPVTAGIANQSAQSVGIAVNINPREGSCVSTDLRYVCRCSYCPAASIGQVTTLNGHYLE